MKQQLKKVFLAFLKCEKLDAKAITELLANGLGECKINAASMLSHSFDGCSSFRRQNTGVSTRIRQLVPSSAYIHCFAHRLNLCVTDMCKTMAFVGFFYSIQDLHIFFANPIVHSVYTKSQKIVKPDMINPMMLLILGGCVNIKP